MKTIKREYEIPDDPGVIARIDAAVTKVLSKRPVGRPRFSAEKKLLSERVRSLREIYRIKKTLVGEEAYNKLYFQQELEIFIAGQNYDEETIARYEREQPWNK